VSEVKHSIVVPVYANEDNIADLITALEGLNDRLESLEVVLVVDGSPDRSLELLQEALPACGFRSQLLVHSRNFGSFHAIRSGMRATVGDYIGVMAADLQEPPELMLQFFEVLDREEIDVVFGERIGRIDPGPTRIPANLFWRLYRRYVVPDVPATGVDVFACNRKVADAVLALEAANTSLVAQLFWVGFRRDFVPYERRERKKGRSSWSLTRRARYLADSFFSFSDLPILVLFWAGVIGLVFAAVLGLVTLVGRLAGAIDEPGYATLVIAVLALFSILIASQGIMGMYLWRAFENSKGLPSGIVMDHHRFAGFGVVDPNADGDGSLDRSGDP
jgi:glycosyltransferase involved in cell wall biosynthesis